MSLHSPEIARRRGNLIALTILLSVFLLPPTAPSRASQTVSSDRINGMTVSTPRGSSAWAGEEMVDTIAELRDMGVNWIAIHPYGRVQTDGTVSWSWPRRRGGRSGESDGASEPPSGPDTAPDWLRKPIAEAHRQGLKILVKPHLENWRDYEWRGAIAYETDAEWDRFFTTYTQWIVRLATFSEGADGFVVGTELGGTTGYEARWREVIGAVRGAYTGPLTYAANWDAYERVGFWDALDTIGIQAYFPLLHEAPADGVLPSQAALDAGWRNVMERVAGFAADVGRPVVFTEAGYNNSPTAPYQPWDWQTRGDAEELQLRCMIAALRAIAAEPAVRGAFLWKWYPGDRVPRDFAMASPRVRMVIRDHWGVGQR